MRPRLGDRAQRRRASPAHGSSSTITPAVGKKRTVVLHTGSTGHFSLAATITANSTVTASVDRRRDFGPSQHSTKVKALAPIVCKADLYDPARPHRRGTCTVAHLPDRTKVTLQYQSKKKHWPSLGSGTTKGTTIVISYKFGAKGKYPVRLVLGANKAYVRRTAPRSPSRSAERDG